MGDESIMEAEQKVGQYTLIRRLAQGGMAEIWLAEQRGPGGFNKEVVIKKILPHLADEGQMTQMFFDEAKTVAQLNHPNVGQVYELGEDGDSYYIAMEFIDGIDLSDLIDRLSKRDQSMPIAFAVRITCDILKALDYAHEYRDRDGQELGLIHRDVSPHNVLISNDGVVKLVDFGIAKSATNEHKTQTGAVKGKFAYMAPEQIENSDLDRRVDIFAVGVVLYELVTGDKPFGDELTAVSQILSGDYPHPRSRRADVPEAIADVVERALAVDPDQRFGSAEAMEQALESYLRDGDGMVGTRELSTMVHQVRGLQKHQPTEQLFGFERQGVVKQPPRMATEGEGEVESQTDPVGGPKDSQTGSHRGVVLAGGVSSVALFVALLIAGVMVLNAIDPPAEAGTTVTSATPDLDDAVIVWLEGSQGAQVYRDERYLGELPLSAYLEVGDHRLEIDDKVVDLEVPEGRSVQRLEVQ